MRPSFVQIAIVILIIVIIFGAPKLPQLARSLGQSMKIFKSEVKDLRDDDEDSTTKSTEPGALNQNSSNDSTTATGGTTGADAPSREKQDPQSHEK
ncbi:Sec-independent protein translocase subunit TatA [Brevibacterium spongiae]|uniref:Sec-independent protein translocase protein TatA n=1 Tax=Brevibacterium spongiae TaxID=2909672 RepID=A0ABY5SMH1_9MICO|nr:Sec-independent protein translocase subunit TatA [Brevibacterium spongiae]UVI34381.1 Sec-independent protein translocase subunit TatA [Brevibacterium spongiae]